MTDESPAPAVPSTPPTLSFDERVERANAAWTPELAEVNTIEAVETYPGAYCETCERNITDEDRAPHDGHEVLDFLYGEQTDDLAMFLAKHLPIALGDPGPILCSCTARLDGPVFYRVHVATVVRAFLGGGSRGSRTRTGRRAARNVEFTR